MYSSNPPGAPLDLLPVPSSKKGGGLGKELMTPSRKKLTR